MTYPMTAFEPASVERIRMVMRKLYTEDRRYERRDLAQELDAVLRHAEPFDADAIRSAPLTNIGENIAASVQELGAQILLMRRRK